MDGSGKDKPSSYNKGKSNIPEGPGVGKKTTQAKEHQNQSASSKQDPPTDRSGSGTGKSDHYNPDEDYDKMVRWLEETPREEPWSAIGYLSRGHRGE